MPIEDFNATWLKLYQPKALILINWISIQSMPIDWIPTENIDSKLALGSTEASTEHYPRRCSNLQRLSENKIFSSQCKIINRWQWGLSKFNTSACSLSLCECMDVFEIGCVGPAIY